MQARPAISRPTSGLRVCRRCSSSATARGSCSRIAERDRLHSRGRAGPAPSPAAELGPFLRATCRTSRRLSPPGRGSAAACGRCSAPPAGAGAAGAGEPAQRLPGAPGNHRVVMNTALPDRADRRSTSSPWASSWSPRSRPAPGGSGTGWSSSSSRGWRFGRARCAAASAPVAGSGPGQDDGW